MKTVPSVDTDAKYTPNIINIYACTAGFIKTVTDAIYNPYFRKYILVQLVS